MVVRASALASNSGSYSSTAHAPRRIQFVKLAGACSGSSLSPPRKLLRLSFAGSWFITAYTSFRSLRLARTLFPSRTDNFYRSPDSLRRSPRHPHTTGVPSRGSQSSEFQISGQEVTRRQILAAARARDVTQLSSRGPKDVVPQRRADSVSDMVILVMMAKVILLQPEP